MVVFLVAFCIVLQLIFLYGIYKENLGLSITYCILISLSTTLAVLKSLYDQHFWTNTILFAFTALMSIVYTRHLWTIVQRKKEEDNKVEYY